MLPRGKVTLAVSPRCRGSFGAHDDDVGVDVVARGQQVAQDAAAIGFLPPVDDAAERLAGDGETTFLQQSELAQVDHHLGDAAGQVDVGRGMPDGAVGQGVDQARHLAAKRGPVVDRGSANFRGVGDGGDVQEQVGRAAEGGVDGHGIAKGCIREDVLRVDAAGLQVGDSAGGAACHFEPERLARGGERGVRQRHAQALADDLRGGGRAEELTAAAGAGAGAATGVGCLLQGQFAVGEASADRLDAASVLAVERCEHDAAGNQDGGQVVDPGEAHHHRWQALVAGGDAEDAAAGRK